MSILGTGAEDQQELCPVVWAREKDENVEKDEKNEKNENDEKELCPVVRALKRTNQA